MKKQLIFEGAGWEKADHNGVGNCRIRTRLTNKKGHKIYLEMSGHRNRSGFFAGNVTHCFQHDANERSEYRKLEAFGFGYTKEIILELVNQNLDCDYETVEVINDNSVRVHDTEEALC